MEYTYTPKGKKTTTLRRSDKKQHIAKSADKKLTEVHVFVAELHVDRKRLRVENLNLCQKDVNTVKREVCGCVAKMSRIKWLVRLNIRQNLLKV